MRRIHALILVCFALAAAVPAAAQDPDPCFSTVPVKLIISPDGGFVYEVTIESAVGPMSFVEVELILSAAARSGLCWCPGSTTVYRQTTNVNGQAFFRLRGGGCFLPDYWSGQSGALVRARASATSSWIDLRPTGTANCASEPIVIISPDVVDSGGRLAHQPGYNPSPPCAVGLPDAVYATPAFAYALVDSCLNFADPLGTPVSLSSIVLFTPYVSLGISCP